MKRVVGLGSDAEQCVYQADTGQLRPDYPVCVGPPNAQVEGTTLRLHLRTPLRLKAAGRYTNRLDFPLLVRALFRRSADLARFHCGAELDLDPRHWLARAAEVQTVSSQVRWYDWERYSQRQERKTPLGGLVGAVEFTGEWQPFLPLLRLGADVHVGKGTGFGLGRYEIV